MQVAIDLSTRSVVNWDGSSIASLDMTCRDKFYVDVKFISAGRFVELPDGAQGVLRLKSPGAWAGLVRAGALEWQKVGVQKAAVYKFYLRLDTVELISLFLNEPDTVGLVMEIEWSYGVPPLRQTTHPVPVVVSNDYIRETDGLPVAALDLKATKDEAQAGVSNEKWMTPLRTVDAVLALCATVGEAEAGSSDAKLMTPFKTRAAIAGFVGSSSGEILVIDAGTY